MKENILKEMCCPRCHGNLQWNIIERNEDRIVNATVSCDACSAKFSVEDEIGNFVLPDDQGFLEEDNFKKQRDTLLNMEKSVIEELKNAKKSELNASDLSYLADIYREQNKVDGLLKLKMFERVKKYSREYNNAIQSQYEFFIQQIPDKDCLILDVATGRGSLLKYMLSKTDNRFVATDISRVALNDLKKELKKQGNYDRVNLIAFNTKKVPFKNESVSVTTSLYAMGHVKSIQEFMSETMRVAKYKFVSIENLYKNDGSKNCEVMIQNHWEDHFEENLKLIAADLNYNVQLLNEKEVIMNPTEKGKIISMSVNSFPIESALIKNCCVILEK